MLAQLRSSFVEMPPCQERDQLASLLEAAVQYRFASDVVLGVEQTVDRVPWTVEHNLDRLARPTEPLWFEFEMPDGQEKAALIFGDVERLYILPVWRRDEIVYHSRALLTFSFAATEKLGQVSRQYLSRDRAEALERMMMIVAAYVPKGFHGELASISLRKDFAGTVDDMILLSKRDASAEAIFLLANLLILETDRVSVVEGADGIRRVTMTAAAPRRTWLRRARAGFDVDNSSLTWHGLR